jgi:hypothetical protein
MSIEEHKATNYCLVEEVWNQRNIDVVDEIFDTDYKHQKYAGGSEGLG